MNKTVLITGSSKGLGEALALEFAKNGYNIILNGRNKKELENVKNKILKKHVKCYSVCGDIRATKTINNLYKVAKSKTISILINNAGIGFKYSLESVTDKQINETIDTNLLSLIKLTKKIYTFFLKKREGTIININSISGLENQELRSIYCASKWGLRGFTDTLKLEAKKNNIGIIGVYPSRIKTKPEYTFGMDVSYVAKVIYRKFKKNEEKDIILDKRPII